MVYGSIDATRASCVLPTLLWLSICLSKLPSNGGHLGLILPAEQAVVHIGRGQDFKVCLVADHYRGKTLRSNKQSTRFLHDPLSTSCDAGGHSGVRITESSAEGRHLFKQPWNSRRALLNKS